MDYLLAASVLFSYIIKGLCGFANTLIFGTIMSFRDDNVRISPIDLLLGLPSNIVMILKERRFLSAKIWLPSTAFMLLGSTAGAVLLKNADAGAVKVFFGLVVTVLGADSLLRQKRDKKGKMPLPLMIPTAVAAGILCGLFGVGALLAACISRMTDNSRAFRGNICMIFALESVYRLCLYLYLGIFTKHILMQVVSALPFMALGLSAGIFLSKKLNEKTIAKAVNLMLMLSGLLLARTLF